MPSSSSSFHWLFLMIGIGILLTITLQFPFIFLSNKATNHNENDITFPQAVTILTKEAEPTKKVAAADMDIDASESPSFPPPECTTDQKKNRTFCCAQNWQHNLDHWWQHHPDWEISKETEDTYCLSPMKDPQRASFLRDTVYPLQWQSNCSNVYASLQTSSGYSATVGLLGKAFLTAVLKNQTTFQWSRRIEEFIWRYANQNGTGICPTADMECYFLKISNCTAEIKQNNGFDQDLYKKEGDETGKNIVWLRSYLARPKLWVRRRIFKLVKEQTQQLSQPCTVIHVRRTDVALELKQIKKRHYFPLSDYLEKTSDSNILLLTDDDSTIKELLDFHIHQRNWTYLPRKRYTGPEGGFLGFFPSGDVIYEMVIILTEVALARQCHKLVHTRSGFAKMLAQEMRLAHPFKNIETIRIDAGRQPNHTFYISPEEFFQKMNKKRKEYQEGEKDSSTS